MDLKPAILKLTDYFGISADGWQAKAILATLESVQAETRYATLREAADAVDNGIMRDNPASTIRALIDKTDAPDPSESDKKIRDEIGWIISECRRDGLRDVEDYASRIWPAIRALIAEPAPPDPLLVALAGLFADWWEREQAAFEKFQRADVTDADFLKAGLIEPVGLVRQKLTALGRAAIALAEVGR